MSSRSWRSTSYRVLLFFFFVWVLSRFYPNVLGIPSAFFPLVFEPPHQPSLHTQRKKKRLRQSIESDRKMGQQKKSIYDSAPLTHRATGHYLLFFFLFSYVPFPCWCMRAHTQQSKLGRWRIKSLTTPEQKERNRQSGKGSLSEPQGEIITKQL